MLALSLLTVSLSTVAITQVGAPNPNILLISPGQINGGQAVGATINFAVKVSQMDPFNTWDIQVAVDPTVLNPTAFTITPNTLTANYTIGELELTHCINGSGTGCTPPSDANGVVHSALFPLGADPPVASVSGVLFNITYAVVNPTGFTTIHLQNTNVVGNGVNLVTTNLDGTYGTLPSTTTTSVNCSGPVVVNQASTCIATVTDTSPSPTTPTRSVSFTSDGIGTFNPSVSCDLSQSALGVAKCQVTYTPTILGTGTHAITASYGGDSTHATSSGPTSLVVNKRSTTTSISCTPNPVANDTSASCKATVNDTGAGTMITPKGTATFSTNATGTFSPTTTCTLAFIGGTTNCSVTYTPTSTILPKKQNVTAIYSGDTNHTISTDFTILNIVSPSTLPHPTSTSVSCTNPVVVNQDSICTATVNDLSTAGVPTTPTGIVQIGTDFLTTPATCSLSPGTTTGIASCSVAITPGSGAEGTHTVTAAYNGDTSPPPGHATSSGITSLTVNLRATATTISCDTPVLAGQSSTCTASLTDSSPGSQSMPTGTVSFTSTGAIGSFSSPTCILSAGSCTVTFTPSASGTANVVAHYPKDSTHDASNSTIFSITSNPRTSSTSLSCTSPVVIGQPSNCTATITDTSNIGMQIPPTSTVTFESTGATGSFNATSCTISAGSCGVTFTPSTSGTTSITAVYSGDAAHSGGSSPPATVTINNAPDMTISSVAVSTSSAVVGEKITATVHVTNNGPYTANLTIEIQWGDITVTSHNETLAAGQSASYTITWDTSGYAPSTATISAVIPPQQYETHSSDNVATDGSFTLASPQTGLLSATQYPIVVGGAVIAAIIVILSAFLLLRRRKTATL